MATANESKESNEYPKATSGVIIASLVAYIGAIFLLMAFCSPYWIESYEETHSSFKNMGLWEYCFKNFVYPNYQFPRYFTGCHNIFSDEYYVIREWLVPGWLMAVQAFICIAFILTFIGLGVLSLVVVRWPLKIVLQYEWILIRMSFICMGISALCIFLAIAVFGGNAYRRDWLMYPKFNVLSWAYSLAVVSFIVLSLSSLILLRESKTSYEMRSEAKNLVAQMEMQEPGFQAPRHHHHHQSQSRSLQGYI